MNADERRSGECIGVIGAHRRFSSLNRDLID
jgi:hypothetical protein